MPRTSRATTASGWCGRTSAGPGRPDVYVADDSTPNYLYRNDGGGNFTDIGLESGTAVSGDGSEQGSMGVAVADYNHTGRFSIYVTNFESEFNTLYRNEGKDNFTDVSYEAGVAVPTLPYVKWGTVFADVDNDGWADLLSVNGHVYPQVDALPSGARYREPQNLLLNQKDGTFCDASAQAGPTLTTPRVGRGLATLDFDNDGSLDFVVENLDGQPMLLRNPGVKGAHWVTFELAGTTSNRLALGTKVTVHAGGMTQIDEVRSGGSYLSQSDLRVHFGLGGATRVDSVEVRWPTGKTETLRDLAPDRIYTVTEGAGVVDAGKIHPGSH